MGTPYEEMIKKLLAGEGDEDKDNPPGGEGRVSKLEEYGFEWVSGTGLSAWWRSPDGELMQEGKVLTLLDSLYKSALSRQAKDPRERINANTGELMIWNEKTGEYEGNGQIIGRPPSGGGSRAAPPQPDIQIAPNGDVIRFDPYTGQPTVVDNVPQLAKNPNLQTFTNRKTGELMTRNPDTGAVSGTGVFPEHPEESPEQQRAAASAATREERAAREAESGRTRAANREEGDRERAFRAGETASSRAYQSGESAIDRAQRASEFAASQGLAERRFGEETEQERRRLGLQGAGQLADVIGSTDPAAYGAFLEGGGASLANAVAGGGTALSDNALLGAARTLRAIEQPYTAQGAVGLRGGGLPQDRGGYDVSGLLAMRDAAMAGNREAAASYYKHASNEDTAALNSMYPGFAPGSINYAGDVEAVAQPAAPPAAPAYNPAVNEGQDFDGPPSYAFGTMQEEEERQRRLGFGFSPTGSAGAMSQGQQAGGGAFGGVRGLAGARPVGATAQGTAGGGGYGGGVDIGTGGGSGGMMGWSGYQTYGLAHGTDGFIPAPETFISGDDPKGGSTPYDEQIDIRDPENNAEVRVRPNAATLSGENMMSGGSLARLMHSIGELLDQQGGGAMAAMGGPPKFGLGTEVRPMSELVTDEDRPYIERIRQRRLAAQYKPFSFMDVGLSGEDPNVMERSLKGLRSRYGVPVESSLAQIRRYALPGLSGRPARQGF